jgi:hypothetical protein
MTGDPDATKETQKDIRESSSGITDPILRAVIAGAANARNHLERDVEVEDGQTYELYHPIVRRDAEGITHEFLEKILMELRNRRLIPEADIALAVALTQDRFPFAD